jgi:hypothetical protein
MPSVAAAARLITAITAVVKQALNVNFFIGISYYVRAGRGEIKQELNLKIKQNYK